MKILLVSIKSDMFPVGMAYISAAIKASNHEVDCFVYDNYQDFINRLDTEKYDFVATGGLSSQYKIIKNISDIACGKNIKLIIGGGIITSEPELMSRALKADYSVIGEGEITIVELLDCIENGSDISTVDGIGYFDEDKYIINSNRAANSDLDLLPYPDYQSFGYEDALNAARSSDIYYFDLFDHPREYPIVTSRSCPFKCTFCYHPLGDTYRQRSIDSVMDELKIVIPKFRINIISIYDELFSHDEKRVDDFCSQLTSYLSTIPWEVKWFCQMKASGLKSEMLDKMKNSGCYMVSYGFESYSPTILKSMKKGITPQQIDNAINVTLDKNISIQANFIFGDRLETMETALETLNYWKTRPEAGILLGFIIPCPNSEIYQYCIEKGIIKDRFDFIVNHMFDIVNITSMSNSDFIELKELVNSHSVSYGVTSIPRKVTESCVIVKCPHCSETITYGNYVIDTSNFYRMIYCRKCRKRFFILNRLEKIKRVLFLNHIEKIKQYLKPITRHRLVLKLRKTVSTALFKPNKH
ncbi:MAG: radical SAM protein [Oryzomonas sp.]|uniref:B12-binding domain-containing radical SAM protein n=1 Tax=Oryzomonas sp. TaxID=2855186 RepID=UPI0028432882|nr:radical SAM protein [Oryzomonas sp.]MDR3578467.1 radical SAM protein [Oryzomonas sp.]